MADDLLSVLTTFHREIMLPDVERTVQDSERRVREEALSHYDALYKRFDRLEVEYQAEPALGSVQPRFTAIPTPSPTGTIVATKSGSFTSRSLNLRIASVDAR